MAKYSFLDLVRTIEGQGADPATKVDSPSARRLAACVFRFTPALRLRNRDRARAIDEAYKAIQRVRAFLGDGPADEELRAQIDATASLLRRADANRNSWVVRSRAGDRLATIHMIPEIDPLLELLRISVDLLRFEGRTSQQSLAISQQVIALVDPGAKKWDQPTLDNYYRRARQLLGSAPSRSKKSPRRRISPATLSALDDDAHLFEEREVAIELPAYPERYKKRTK